MRSAAVTLRQGNYLYCVHFFFNCWIHLCIIIQQTYSAAKRGHRVVMATPSIAPAAKFLNVSLRKCSWGKNCTERRDRARWSRPQSSQWPEPVPQTCWRADRLRETRLQPEQISRRSARASPSSTWGHFTLARIPPVWRRKRREQDSRERDKVEDVLSGRTRNVLK